MSLASYMLLFLLLLGRPLLYYSQREAQTIQVAPNLELPVQRYGSQEHQLQ